MVRTCFEFSTGLTQDIYNFEANITSWNKEVFGNIFQNKKEILAKVEGIQRSVDYPYSSFRQNLETNFTKDYSDILK